MGGAGIVGGGGAVGGDGGVEGSGGVYASKGVGLEKTNMWKHLRTCLFFCCNKKIIFSNFPSVLSFLLNFYFNGVKISTYLY